MFTPDERLKNEVRQRFFGPDGLADKYDVDIILAVESGSRAWGFESANSDYDVRFIYSHRNPNKYLDIERYFLKTPDTIEVMDGDFDFAGWDISKALWLMRKSNPPLYEWLNSPIVYHKFSWEYDLMVEVSKYYFTEERSYKHYLHMASGNYKEYLKGDTVRLKKYLYVLRPLLACLWLEKYHKDVPVKFDILVKEFLTGDLYRAVMDLLDKKKMGLELDSGPRIEEINKFVEDQIPRMEKVADDLEVVETDIGKLNEAFRKIAGF